MTPRWLSWLLLVAPACTGAPAPKPSDTDAGTDTDTDTVTTVEVGPYDALPVRILPLGDSITEYCYRYNLWTKLVDADYAFDLVGSMTDAPLLDGQAHTWPSYAGLDLDTDHAATRAGRAANPDHPRSWDADKGTLYDWLEGYTPDVVLVVWSAPGAGSGIWNNLFVVDHDWLATVAGDVPMSNNLWWQPVTGQDAWFDDYENHWYNGVEAWEAAGRETDSLYADPLLVGGSDKDAVQLGAGSPAIDAGTVITDDGGCDGFGNPLAGAPDIGAHAYGAVADPGCGG